MSLSMRVKEHKLYKYVRVKIILLLYLLIDESMFVK